MSLEFILIGFIRLIEIDINHLERLEILDVSKNKIMNFKDMSRLKSLRTLNAGYNNIETCSIFENLPCLISLNLTHNKIRRLNGLLIANMSMLEILDVSFNLIERLTSIETLQNLVEFNMSSNNAISISLTRTINRLCNLNLSFNRLTEFDAKWFPNARIVYLDENIITRVYELTSIPRVTSFSLRNQEDLYNFDLYYLRSTRKLYLSGYPFRRMTQFFDFFTLKYLELCSAELDELPADFSNRAPNLSRLHLSMNRLQDIRPLKPLKELKQLVLLGNNLVSILDIISVVKHLEKLVVLDLR
ncbi:hypothetical protein INT47_004557 [Mucor saturninus]|uniref:Uncharacterized protein n=1 Tax=Mucor saturninus TaxID=64648 RepID=A0A8H7RJU6_9FUNG|nr:hypothetical protein INT47_004557 [Mucor saturninus]